MLNHAMFTGLVAIVAFTWPINIYFFIIFIFCINMPVLLCAMFLACFMLCFIFYCLLGVLQSTLHLAKGLLILNMIHNHNYMMN